MRLEILRGNTMAGNALQIEITGITGFVDEDHPIRQLGIYLARHIAMGLVPMLEAAGNEVDLEARFY